MRTIIPTDARLIPKHAKKVFTGQIYDVYQWEQELYNGTTATFEMLGRPDTIIVLPIKDGKIVIVDEEQPTMKRAYGLPGGRHDNPTETELEAAQREVLEETGMRFKTWKLIRAFQPHSKIEQFIYLFVASDFIDQRAQNLDAGEKIEVLEVTLERAREIAATGESRDLPGYLLEEAKSVQDLIDLPEYQP